MRMMKKFKGQKAFSLIELLVVVGIIGVLAAVGVPKYSKYQARSRDAAAVTYMTTVATGVEANQTLTGNAYLKADANLAIVNGGLAVPNGYVWDAAATAGAAGAYRVEIDTNGAGAIGSCQTANYNIFGTQASAILSGIAGQCL